MGEPQWIIKPIVIPLHGEQLSEHGGSPGLRDEGLLDSALNRPRQLFTYGQPDLAALAAAYAFGLAKNHAFVDGNKRVSLSTTLTFLDLNGFDVAGDDADMLATWMALASGQMDEGDVADWLRNRMIGVDQSATDPSQPGPPST